MDIKERQDLRIWVLKEYYDLYFCADTKSSAEIDLRQLRKDNYEKYLAYEYLIEKGLLKDVRQGGNTPKIQISIYGIDLIEAIELKKTEN